MNIAKNGTRLYCISHSYLQLRFHSRCINTTREQVEQMGHYTCLNCKKRKIGASEKSNQTQGIIITYYSGAWVHFILGSACLEPILKFLNSFHSHLFYKIKKYHQPKSSVYSQQPQIRNQQGPDQHRMNLITQVHKVHKGRAFGPL